MTEEQISTATTAVMDEYGSGLCAWIDANTKRVCRVNVGKPCICRQIAMAVLRALKDKPLKDGL